MYRRKKIIWILTGAAILVLAAAALLVWRHRGGGGEGTTIQSTKAHPLPEAVYYLQKDEEWAAARWENPALPWAAPAVSLPVWPHFLICMESP